VITGAVATVVAEATLVAAAHPEAIRMPGAIPAAPMTRTAAVMRRPATPTVATKVIHVPKILDVVMSSAEATGNGPFTTMTSGVHKATESSAAPTVMSSVMATATDTAVPATRAAETRSEIAVLPGSAEQARTNSHGTTASLSD
jgi:hypothetical protein